MTFPAIPDPSLANGEPMLPGNAKIPHLFPLWLCLATFVCLPILAVAECVGPTSEGSLCAPSDLTHAYDLGVTYGQMDLPRSPPFSVEGEAAVNCFIIGYAMAGIQATCFENIDDFLEQTALDRSPDG